VKKNNLNRWMGLLSVIVLLGVFFLASDSNGQSSKKAKPLWTELDSKNNPAKDLAIDVVTLNNVFTSLAERLSKSVVSISTKTRVVADPRMNPHADLFRFFFGSPFDDPRMQPRGRESQSLGSGFVINSEGYIITNSHVIRPSGRNADEIFAKFVGDAPNFEGHKAEVVGVDESTDVAVIKIARKPEQAQIAVLGKSEDVKVGEWVLAIGNPYGHSHSVTSGIVSALGRSIDLDTRTDFIQTDASINPGNSGGPLFNLKGEVIGINTAIDARAQGIGFAVPVDVAKNVVRQLIEKGEVELGWIGIYMRDMNAGIARQLGIKQETGVLVQEVIPGEPAEKAGLRSYDVISEVNGVAISSIRELSRQISNLAVGAKAKIKVLRDGRTREFTVEIGRRKSDAEMAQREQERLKDSVDAGRGMLLSDLTPQIRSQMGLPSDLNGVLVQRVMPRSFAAEAGVMAGDILLEVNRKPLKNIKEAQAELARKADSFLLKLQRQNSTIIILMETPK
jgi:serine protease Do